MAPVGTSFVAAAFWFTYKCRKPFIALLGQLDSGRLQAGESPTSTSGQQTLRAARRVKPLGLFQMRTRILLTVFLAAIVAAPFIPIGGAQTQTPVASCTQECDPKDPKVNPTIPVTSGPVKVILYAHFEDILQLAPLNTQAPDAQKETDHNQGFLMPVLDTNTGLGCAQGNCLDFHFKNNEFTMFSSPGLVEYLTDGWRTHQEPGLAADTVIAASEFNLYWYMSSHVIPGDKSSSSQGGTARVGVMPQVAVYARMETGRHKFHGQIIAESLDMVDPNHATRVNMITTPSAVEPKEVYEFQVKMQVKMKVIPSAESAAGFLVYINPYQIKNGGNQAGSTQVAQEEWRVRSGAKFPPRLVIPLDSPMATKASTLSIFEDSLFVRWSFVSALGSYDMKDASLLIRSTGPSPINVEKQIEHIILKRSVDHDGHFKPVNSTWRVDYGMQNPEFKLADGDYELTASISNLQETFLLEQKFPFKVVKGVPDVPRIGGSRSASGGGAGGAASANGE
ncbi:MAG TPA: hypothetical protein VI818_03290, partial [Candidatus Thermoplasmatota archaeon]|nr:hypothetical protein [Candidatus Thermoplasmatota archaeon]